MANEHLSFILEDDGTYPAWSTPSKSIPVTSAAFSGSRVNNRFEDTGATVRSRKYQSQGAVTGTGSIAMRAYPVGLLPYLFRAFLTDVDTNAASTGYDNDMLPNDSVDTQLPWFSFQQKHNASVGQNARGAVLSSLSLSCTGGEEANISADFVVADVARTGGTWSDGTSSAALVTPNYDASFPALVGGTTLPPPFRFHEGGIYIGNPTLNKSGNKFSLDGASPIATIESVNLSIALNTEGRFPIRDGAPTVGYTRHGERNIELTAEIDWSSYGTTYYDYMKAATESIVQLSFISDATYVSGQPYEMIITLPRVVAPEDAAPFPQTDGTHMPKKQSLKFIAMEDETYSLDIGVSFQSIMSLQNL